MAAGTNDKPVTYYSLGNGNWYQYTVDYVNGAGETVADRNYVANACDTTDYTKTIPGTAERDISDAGLIGPGVQSTENCTATIAGDVVSATSVTANAKVVIRAAVAKLMSLGETAVATDDMYHYSLTEAVTACDPATQYVQMISGSVEEDSVIDKAVYIDLFGRDVSVKSIANAKLFDSSTDDYDQEPDGSIKVMPGEDGTDAQTKFALVGMSPKYYVKTVNTDGSLAFPRVAVHVTGIQFALEVNKDAEEGEEQYGYLTFRGTFRGNAKTAEKLSNVGFRLNNSEADQDQKWFGTSNTDKLNHADQTHFYYTKKLTSINDITHAAALMQFVDAGEPCVGVSVNVNTLLQGLMGGSAADWTQEEKAAFADYLDDLTSVTPEEEG